MNVLVIGGTGVFGSRLARRLVENGHHVTITSRNAAQGETFARSIGAQWSSFARGEDAIALIKDTGADMVIDAAGPFQDYGTKPYAIAEAAIAAKAHYLDLSDDAVFTKGISALDDAARNARVAVLSGVSSVPALSSVVAAELADGLAEIKCIESAIMPGNRAPRGHAVMRAILSQIGETIPAQRGGAWTNVIGWAGEKTYQLPGNIKRKASFIGAPDLLLFPQHFQAETVLFRAGLELGIFQRSLALFSWLRARRLLPNLERFTGLFQWIATLVEPLGSDQGGMVVSVAGRTTSGKAVERQWRLRIAGGEGPNIPTLPAAAMLEQWQETPPTPGARPCLVALPLDKMEALLAEVGATLDRHERPCPPLFERYLSSVDDAVPQPLMPLHDIWDRHLFTGEGHVTRGKGVFANLAAFLFRFPPEGPEPKVQVIMERCGQSETWTRLFGSKRFSSVLSDAAHDGRPALFERFGPLKAQIDLKSDSGALLFPLKRAWMFGIPLPKWLTPQSNAREFAQDGALHFDVELSLPITGLIVRYQGALRKGPPRA